MTFNQADTEFVLEAGSQLGTTLSAAQVAAKTSTDPAVVALSRDIVGAREHQVEDIARWLRQWGRQGAEFGHDAASHTHEEPAQGLTNATMERLPTLTGPRFDRVFLRALATHLESGSELWRTEATQGADPAATALGRQLARQDSAFARRARSLLAG